MSKTPRRTVPNSSRCRYTSLEQKEKDNIRATKWFQNNRERRKKYIREWNKNNRDKISIYQKRHKHKLRLKVFRHYSNGEMKCACCGETQMEFFTIDHIDGGGNKHRKSIGSRGGHGFYSWLINNNYPSGYRVLCYNCNMALGACGYCPHEGRAPKIVK